jgi:glycerol-1-phosphate dehydrogenase [NAD(P)+]
MENRDHSGIVGELAAGTWVNPKTGVAPHIPIERIVIRDSLDGLEAELVAALGLGPRLTVVCDQNTEAILGGRVASALASVATVDKHVLSDPRTTGEQAQQLSRDTAGVDALIAVGSGTVNDLVKYATHLDGRRYAVFPTSPMNAFSGGTASITLDGFKKSIPTHSAVGVFYDLGVLRNAPMRLLRSGFADIMCRSTAQVDWLMSNMLLDTPYDDTVYILQAMDEEGLIEGAGALSKRETDEIARLTRMVCIVGVGTAFSGGTHYGSMAEHMISHYIDMFAGEAHPGSLHGEQVGVTTLTVSRLQNQVLGSDTPPVLEPTRVDRDALVAKYGPERGTTCATELAGKAFDAAKCNAVNRRFAEDWAGFVAPLRAVMLPVKCLHDAMRAAGARMTAMALGLDPDFYRDAVRNARETRNRYSILDLAGDAGLLDAFAEGEE